ncbi:hypothetical protein F5972_08100 [Microbispora cellulosiformans]|uniref:Glycosyltransferase family 2 protein n=1 Tax=Microbispora cellulosiformans TaxID=2614688 RepID=A0A5J5K740_9ACTN|nr:hypothetical protein [Microbispora cellulosiformans]KAA9379608.1 hypothetical protein F5972_08100 [Microbispora cellulosiformans]
MGVPDLVVPVREGPANEQLRYALRSWTANLPHSRVWVVGGRPGWLTGVGHIPLVQNGSKYENTTAAVRAACLHPGVSEEFLLCNDDFFVMRPVGVMPVLHRGPIDQVEAYYAARASSAYLGGMRDTRTLLARLGVAAPLSYELHVPLPVTKAAMLGALDAGRHLPVLHKRTLYGNLAGLGGEQMVDVKVLTRGPRFDRDAAFLSTMPDTFVHGQVGAFIRARFPDRCRYERSRG